MENLSERQKMFLVGSVTVVLVVIFTILLDSGMRYVTRENDVDYLKKSEACTTYFQLEEMMQLAQWIEKKEGYNRIVDFGYADLEQVKVIKKKLDYVIADLNASIVVRLSEMNEIAMQLITLGQTDIALKLQSQMKDVNLNLAFVQQLKAEGIQYLVNQVQLYFRRNCGRSTKSKIPEGN